MNVSTISDWSKTSPLLAEHECNILYGRNDLVHLLSAKVEAKQVTPELSQNIRQYSQDCCPPGSLDKYRQGATYVPISDIITLHLAQSYDDGNSGLITAIKDNNREIHCRRSWSRTINIVQMEDIHCYGFQFRNIPPFATPNKASMMTWTLCSILSNVKELWQAVDTKSNPFRHDGWEGWILTHIQ